MKKDSSTMDMERIQRGLEEFLQQEMKDMENSEPRLYDLQEDWDSKEYRRSMAASRRQEKQEARDPRSIKRRSARRSEVIEPEEEYLEEGYQEQIAPRKNRREKSKKRRKKKSKLKGFVISFVLVLALLAGGLYYIVGSVYDKLNYEEITTLASEPVEEEDVVNILLIGSDSRTGGNDGRSDAMILLSISKETKTIYMTSLLRDMYVEIPGYKGNRLNAAYSYGGAELLMDTIEHNFDISVNRYMLVNFEAFANLVDAVGGIELELSKEEVEYVNGYLWEYNIITGKPEGTDYMDTSISGMVHLNGPQALAYTRNRYLGTDFGRTERQRKVLSAVIGKLPGAVLTNSKELFDGLMPNLTTNLTKGECYSLSFLAAQALGYEIVQGSIPLEGTYRNATIRNMSVLEVDFEANKKYIQENIYGKIQ